jgi:hypothetical protein
LVDEDDFGKGKVAHDRLDGGGVVGELEALGEEALIDDVVEKGGLAGAGDAAEADEALEGEAEGELAEIVLGGVFKSEGGMLGRNGPAAGGDGN